MKHQNEVNSEDNKSSSSVIRLSLRKPREWNWSLTTSSSSPAILLPTIQLWDEEEGNLLVDTRRQRRQVRSKTAEICPNGNTVKQNTPSRSPSKLPTLKQSNWPKDVRLKSTTEGDHFNENMKNERISKFSSHRSRKDEFVQPSQPRIPVSVARRVSLPKETKPPNPPDFTMLARKKQSAIPKPKTGQSVDKNYTIPTVKESESFRGIDTKNLNIDGNKTISNWKTTIKRKSQENTIRSINDKTIKNSQPRSKQDMAKDKINIPVLKLNSSKAIIERFNNKSKENSIENNKKNDVPTFRKQKMELFICDGPVKNRFNIRRLDENCETSGNKPSTNNTNSAVPVQSVLKRVEKEKIDSKVTKPCCNNSDQELYHRTTNRKKVYRKRVSRRGRENTCSSSSESEMIRLRERPRRKRRSKRKKGNVK